MEHTQHPYDDASPHDHSKHWNPWILGGVAAVGAVSLAPYLLPLVGVGTPTYAEGAMHYIGGQGTPLGSGAAGTILTGLSHIPWLGDLLTSTSAVAIPGLGISVAAGTLATIGFTAAIGIGGMLLANWVEKHETDDARVKWSKIIRTVSLVTSTLIALPSILGSISIGLSFLASTLQLGNDFQIGKVLAESIGAPKMLMTGSTLTGLAAMLPHLFTCCLPLMPVAAAMFMDMKHQAPTRLPPRTGSVRLVSTTAPQRGEPTRLSFQLMDETGTPLAPQDIVTTHTKKLHTMVVDQSLSDYHHLHPQYDAATGLFTCEFTPRLNARYSAWHDFTLHGNTDPTIQRSTLRPAPGCPELPPRLLPASHAEAGNLRIDISSTGALVAGKPGMLHIRVTDAQGQPVNDLQPIMGAYGHLAGFSDDGSQFIHSHPMTMLGNAISNGELQFHIAPASPGMSKFFLQLKRDGQEVTLPFVQPVRQPAQAVDRHALAQAMQPRLAPAL